MDTHRHLRVWRDARRLVSATYRLTKLLPADERYVVVPQLRRAAWSVQDNIAEGNAKLGRREMRRFFDASIGSLAEIDSMVITLPDLYSLDPTVIEEVLVLRELTSKRLFSLLRRPGR